jgi:hypothetical protein
MFASEGESTSPNRRQEDDGGFGCWVLGVGRWALGDGGAFSSLKFCERQKRMLDRNSLTRTPLYNRYSRRGGGRRRGSSCGVVVAVVAGGRCIECPMERAKGQ